MCVQSAQSCDNSAEDFCFVTISNPVSMCRIIEITYHKKIRRTEMEKKYVCPLCGYVYDGEIPFEELPDSYLCPLCGAAKSDFIEQEA